MGGGGGGGGAREGEWEGAGQTVVWAPSHGEVVFGLSSCCKPPYGGVGAEEARGAGPIAASAERRRSSLETLSRVSWLRA